MQNRHSPRRPRNGTSRTPIRPSWKDGASKGFEQAYNAQAAVDSTAQVIVAQLVTQEANDKQQLKPLVEKVQVNCQRLPEKVSADAGYFNTKQLTNKTRSSVDLPVSPDRQKHGNVLKTSALATTARAGSGVVGQMREKSKTAAGQAVYQRRKAIVEPVFGQIKEKRGSRRFASRGLAKVSAEWALICLAHTLPKLWRAKLCLFTS